jgi:hypothetical protein
MASTILIAQTKQTLIERIKRHIANGFPDSSFSATDREILLYVDQAIAYTLVGQVYNTAKVTGNIEVPEGYLTTYSLATLSYDSASGYWYSTLPQPPVSLPLGYSINRVYAALAGSGQSQDFYPIKAKRLGFRRNMPMPSGGRYWGEGVTIWMAMSDGSSLGSYNFFVQMAKSRTESLTEVLEMPDDAIELVFKNVTDKLVQRMQLPKDVIQDDLPSGNKTDMSTK